jgi:hypothetical protein
MTGDGGSSGPTAELLAAGLRRAAFIGFVLLQFTVTSWLLIRALEGSPAEPGDNPMRPQFASIWPSVAEGQTVADVIGRMGPPDEESEQSERIPECAGTCRSPCDRFHTCVREYEWASAPEPESATTYSVCADADGIVRRTCSGIRFNLGTTVAGEHDAVGMVLSLPLMVVLAIPFAVFRGLRNRAHAVRRLSLGLWDSE